jgi:hypothetical protein
MKITPKRKRLASLAIKPPVASQHSKGQNLKLTSSLVKTAVLSHFRFDLGYINFATEVSEWNSDIMLIDPRGNLIEIEVKVSISDLKEDFKKPKHRAYLAYAGRGGMVPNRFFFAVPKSIQESALKVVSEHAFYGLLTVDDSSQIVGVRRPAGLIHNFHKASDKARRVITLRMGSELIRLRKKLDKTGDWENDFAVDDILDLAPFIISEEID